MLKTSLALLLCAAGAWAAGQPWSPDDLWNWRTPSDPRISPDGQNVLYVESWNDRTANAGCSNLWLVCTRDKQVRRLSEGPWRDRLPRWSPDSGRVAWISGRGGIHVLTLNSGQEIAISGEPLSLAWSADGRLLAFTSTVTFSATPPAWAPAAILPWLTPHISSRVAVFVVPAMGGSPRALTAPDFDSVGAPVWMPDGKSLLIASADGEIYSIHVADGAARRLIQESGRKENPLPSPNGAKIAWMTSDAQPHSYSVKKLHVMNADGTRIKELAGAMDRDPAEPQWSSDSRTIYFLADDSGSTHVFASRADSTVRQVTKGVERLNGLSLADNGRAVTVRSAARSTEVVTFAVDVPSVPELLAAPVEKLLPQRETGAVEEIYVPSAGKTIQAWIVKPPQFDAGRKYPLLLDIADAPRRMYGAEFDLCAQIYAAHGWLVLRVNPRGTPGYGEQFGRLLPTRYPGDDADDLLGAVGFVIARGGVDEKRVAVSGGLLAAWLIGHSDRFTSAIARHTIVDFAQYAAESPGRAQQVRSWMNAMPWEDTDQYVRHSPIFFAQNWKTPTLVLASNPDPQAEEFYAGLQQRKVASSMVRIPDIEKPANRILEWETILAWLEKGLATDAHR